MLSWLVASVVFAARPALGLPECSSNCTFDACTLIYGAVGVVRDAMTDAPIAGATIVVLDAEGVSAADGSYDVRGSHPDRCHLDYLFSISVTAVGYRPYSQSAYWPSAFAGAYEIRLDPIDGSATPTASPTPTLSPYPGPSITVPPCPERTPCVLGEQPRPCDDRCGLGCGCQACPQCTPGWVSAPRFNFCECIPDPNVTPPPTSTPGNCFHPTPPLCPLGQTARCVTENGCDSACSCVPCDACPPELVYSGEPNGCLCVDPRTPSSVPSVPSDPADAVSMGGSDGCAIVTAREPATAAWLWPLVLLLLVHQRRSRS